MSLKNLSRFLFLVGVGFTALAAAEKNQSGCPSAVINQRDLPTCPEGWLVPENYPVGAVVVSDVGGAGQESGFTADVVVKALKASGENNPLFLLPVGDDTMKRVRSRIDEMPISEDLKTKYKKSLIHINTGSFTWQQDYMQAFANPKTGKIVLRNVKGYWELPGRSTVATSVKAMVAATKGCGISQGPELEGNTVSGMFGGNIETLPAGICLLGNDHFENREEYDRYANQVCSVGAENRVVVPTDWLTVGHSDEVIKVVRNKNAKAPCDFSIAVASPKKALELLRKNPKEEFLDFSNVRGMQSSTLMPERIRANSVVYKVCNKVMDQRRHPEPNKSPNKSEGAVSKILNLENILFTKAHAGAFISGLDDSFACGNMSNDEVYRTIMAEPDLKKYNELVQEKMDALKLDVAKKLKAKLPQCETDFIDFPNLFSGGTPVEVSPGKFELPLAQGDSALPNPTNAISINDTIISPDPSNVTFKKYMQEEYGKRGLKSEFVDTYEYAHVLRGNLHCSTNTFHVCKPRGEK